MYIETILANRHIFDGHVNGKPVRFLINFLGGRNLRLQVAGDGASLTTDNGELDVPTDLGEFGKLDVADVTEALFPQLYNADVADIQTLVKNRQLVGLKLNVANGLPFYFWVDDDELYWGPDDALVKHGWRDNDIPVATGYVHV